MAIPSQQIIGSLGGTLPLESAFIGSAVLVGGGPPKTFSSQGIGAANSGRYVVVAISISIGANQTFTSCTVGGASTSILQHTINSIATNGHGEAIIVITDSPVTTGSTADIVVNCSSGVNGVVIGVYTLVNLESTTATHAAGATVNASGGAAGTASLSIGVEAKGATISAYGTVGWNGSGHYDTWTGLPEDYSINGYSFSAGIYAGGASLVSSTGSTLSVSVTVGDISKMALAAVSFL